MYLGKFQVSTTDLHHECTGNHIGTSASAPLAAGICALALEANTELTWRDMQHIVIHTARPKGLKASDWNVNGVGRPGNYSVELNFFSLCSQSLGTYDFKHSKFVCCLSEPFVRVRFNGCDWYGEVGEKVENSWPSTNIRNK